MNVCIFTGNLTRDPEIKYTPSGKAVCNFSIAQNRKYGDKEQVTYLECVAWEKTAELVGEYLKKGSKIGIVSRARQESWDDRDTGAKRSKLVFDVTEVEFLDKKGDRDGDSGGGDAPASTSARKTKAKAAAAQEDNDSGSDDVPF